VRQDPGANTLAAKGSTVTLLVSKGPTQSVIPDVSSQSRSGAVATLKNSGFKVIVNTSDVQDAALDDIVLFQTPGPGTFAAPGTPVTITVGHYVPPAPTTTTEPTTTADTTTDTTTTDTTTLGTPPAP
jgi:serine/threonine-protein kinase